MDNRPPYSPSFPAGQGQDDEGDLQEFHSRVKERGREQGLNKQRRQPLFHDVQDTIVDAAQEEIVNRGEVATELIEEIDRQVQEDYKKRKKKRTATGFWIFGHLKKQDMAPGFRNPDMCSQFIIKILSIMITRQLIRQPCLSLFLLYKPLHDWFFAEAMHTEPIFLTAGIYAVFLLISHNNRITTLIRRYQLHAILFILSEITLGVVQCFAAFLLEYGAFRWYGTLDTFNDYDEDEIHDWNNWRQLKLTPPVFLIVYDLQITVNITGAMLLQAFTPIHIGAHELYRIMIWLSFLTFILSFLVVLTSTYGLLPIWDGFQSVLGSMAGLGKGWIFVYKISRLMSGRMVPISSMDWNDVFYAAYVVF